MQGWAKTLLTNNYSDFAVLADLVPQGVHKLLGFFARKPQIVIGQAGVHQHPVAALPDLDQRWVKCCAQELLLVAVHAVCAVDLLPGRHGCVAAWG